MKESKFLFYFAVSLGICLWVIAFSRLQIPLSLCQGREVREEIKVLAAFPSSHKVPRESTAMHNLSYSSFSLATTRSHINLYTNKVKWIDHMV